MNIRLHSSKTVFIIAGISLICSLAIPIIADAGGISVDAGLTPPLDRWIVRTQLRFMQRINDPTPMNRDMDMYMFPLVIAYGLRPNLTVMIKQPYMSSEMTMDGHTSKAYGLGDLFVLAKYRAYRLNTPEYTLGIAPAIGLNIPSGHEDVTDDVWNLTTGLFFSWRSGFWASDVNIDYTDKGLASVGEKDVDPGNELGLNLAFAYQIPVGPGGKSAIAPVLELNYAHIGVDILDGHDIIDTGESVLYFSPGVKFTASSIVLELLIQNPVTQTQKGSQLERGTGVIVGTRLFF